MSRARPDSDRLISKLVGPEGPELTCEECFEQLDRYVELELAKAHPDEQIPRMRAHLQGCPACNEDYVSLRVYVSGQDQVDR